MSFSRFSAVKALHLIPQAPGTDPPAQTNPDPHHCQPCLPETYLELVILEEIVAAENTAVHQTKVLKSTLGFKRPKALTDIIR